jgi:hypothetical protein
MDTKANIYHIVRHCNVSILLSNKVRCGKEQQQCESSYCDEQIVVREEQNCCSCTFQTAEHIFLRPFSRLAKFEITTSKRLNSVSYETGLSWVLTVGGVNGKTEHKKKSLSLSLFTFHFSQAHKSKQHIPLLASEAVLSLL